MAMVVAPSDVTAAEVRTASCSTRTSGELLNGLRHIDFVETKYASAHHAVLELLADGVGWVEEALHAFDQTSVCGWVDSGITWRHHGSVFVQLLLRLQAEPAK